MSLSCPISFRLLTALRLRIALAGVPTPLVGDRHRQWLKTIQGETERISLSNERDAIDGMLLMASQAQEYVRASLIAAADDQKAPVRLILESTSAALQACIDACHHYFD